MKTLQIGSFNDLAKLAINWGRTFSTVFLLCGLAMLLLPAPARAAIALQDAPVGITNSPLTSTSISKSFAVTAGANVLVVTLLEKTSTSTGITPTTLTWNGMTLTRAVRTIDTATTYREAAVYYVYNPVAGTANITGTLTAAPVCTYLEAYTLSGVDTTAPPVTGAANSISGTSSFLSFNVAVAANSWAAVGGVLGSKSVAGVAVTGTGGNSSGVFLGNDASADNCAFAFGYISGLSAGSDTISYSWTLPGTPNPTANAFVAAVFAPPTPPTFVKQPESLSLYSGGMVNFSTITAGATSYQWLSNSVPLTGATNTTLAYGPGSADVVAGANYSVVATSANGSVTSSIVTVSIRTPSEPYETAIANLGPYAFYQLNETANAAATVGGATAFDNANSLNGIYGIDAQNSFNSIAGPTPSAGFPGFANANTALQTINNDANSTVTLPSLNLNTNTVTMAAWIYPIIHEGANVALVFCRGGGSGVIAGLNYSPNFNGSDYSLGYTWNNDPNTFNWDSQLYVPLNQWSLVALTVTPTNATIYLLNANGIASSRHDYSHIVQTFNGVTLVGGDSTAANRTFFGTIDDVAVFSKALTRDQLSTVFYAASGLTNYSPIIVTPPANQSVYVGQSATFKVVGGGSQPLTYQWQADTGTGFTNINNGGQFSGANGMTLTINGATSDNTGNYQVILSNSWGTIDSSSISSASLSVNTTNAPINITLSAQQPVGADWNATGYWNDGQGGLPASVSAGEFPGSTYELLAGSRLRTPTNPAVMFPGIQLTIDGTGVWTNNPGSGSSMSEIRLKTQALPVGNGTINFPKLVMNGGQIDNGPDGIPVGYVTIGGEVDIFSNAPIYNDGAGGDNCGYNLTAWLTGSGTVEYHGDATGSIPFNTLTNNLNVSNATNSFKGTWNIASGILLGSASGSLGTNTIVIGSPTAATNTALETTYDIHNTNGNLILFGKMFLHQNDTFRSVFVNGTPLTNGTYSFATLNSTYPTNFPSLWALQNGSTVSNGSGSITVLVNPSPIIVAQPQSMSLYPGQAVATFSLTAVGNMPLSYQWFTNGTVALNDNGNRIGSTSNVLTIPSPTFSDGANYTVVVTNIYGAATSSVAVLTVLTPGPAMNFALDFGGTPIAQPVGAYWDTLTNWNPNGQPASVLKYSNPGSTFEVVVGARLRTPNFTNYAAFPGNQLTIDGDGIFENATLNNVGELRLKHPSVMGTNYFNKLIMNGGQINNSGVDGADTSDDLAVLQGEIDIIAPTPIYIESTAPNNRSIQIDSLLTGSGTIFWHSFDGTLAGTDLRITGSRNTFSGQWVVDQGALLGVAAGSLGTNSIIVGTNGLTATIETLYDVNDTSASLILGANGEMFLHQNDHFASVTVNGTPLANGTYSFATLNSTYPANFPASWTLQNGSAVATGSGQIVVGSGSPSSPHIANISVIGTSLSISATNGAAGGPWTLLQSTNLALPLGQWLTNTTGSFDGGGNLSTNILNTATNGQEFYILKVQ